LFFCASGVRLPKPHNAFYGKSGLLVGRRLVALPLEPFALALDAAPYKPGGGVASTIGGIRHSRYPPIHINT
jgi:hypothetical protein